jgi:hypothetical protein
MSNLAVDRDRSIVATGSFTGTIDFGGGPLTSTPDDSPVPYPDAFLARFDENGQHLWSRRYGEKSYQYGGSLSISGAGQIAVSGIGVLGDGNDAIPDPWFLMVTDGQGQPIWARTFRGMINNGVSVSWAGDGMVVVGSFDTTLDIGLGPTMAAGTDDRFLARFEANGTPSWSTRFGSDYDNGLGGFTTDAKGRTVVSGNTRGFFQPMNLAGTIIGAKSWETFVAMFDERGAPAWAKVILRDDDGARYAPLASTVDETGAIYFAGLSDSPSAIYVGKLLP